MKKVNVISVCLACLTLSIVFLPLNSRAHAGDFEILYLDPDWEPGECTTLSFATAAMAFDREHNLYASDLFEDWGPGGKNILRLEPPDYDSPTVYLSYETGYDGINGMDFDRDGNLLISEFMGRFSGSDAGSIRKNYAFTAEVSDPIEFTGFPGIGDFRPTGIAAGGSGTIYFPGRKHSWPNWGNIYTIASFETYDPSSGPSVYIGGHVATAIELDKWGNLYVGTRPPDNSIWTVNPNTGDHVRIAKFNDYVEELTFDAEGNLYALEGVSEPGDVSTIIELIPPYVAIDGCNTGVIDWPLPEGDKISAVIAVCEAIAGNHGEFVRCVVDAVIDLKHDGFVSGRQTSAIAACAAQADIP